MLIRKDDLRGYGELSLKKIPSFLVVTVKYGMISSLRELSYLPLLTYEILRLSQT